MVDRLDPREPLSDEIPSDAEVSLEQGEVATEPFPPTVDPGEAESNDTDDEESEDDEDSEESSEDDEG
jgi:hypothetical protein